MPQTDPGYYDNKIKLDQSTCTYLSQRCQTLDIRHRQHIGLASHKFQSGPEVFFILCSSEHEISTHKKLNALK